MLTTSELKAKREKALAAAEAILAEGRAAGGLLEDAAYYRCNQHVAEADLFSRQIADAGAADEVETTRRPNGTSLAIRGDSRRITSGLEEHETHALKPEQRFADWVREHRGVEDHDLALGDYLRAMVLGAKTDAEKRALSEGTDSAGGFTVPEILSAQLIDLLRARTVAIQAGARTVPLTSDTNHVARLLTDPVPAWRSEAGAVAESDPTFGRITFSPKSLAVLIKASRELLEDSLNIRTELPRVIAGAMAVELDRVALFGSGSDPEPTGLTNVSGINEITHDAALTSYAPFVSARTKVLESNADGVSAFVLNPRDDGTLAGLADTTNQPLMKPEAIRDIPFLTSMSVPTNLGAASPPTDSIIVGGSFRHLLIGMRSEIRIEVLRERFADNLQYGFLAWLRADVAVEHAAAFSKITGISA